MTNRVFHLHEGATYIEHQENHFHDQSQQVWNDTSKELSEADKAQPDTPTSQYTTQPDTEVISDLLPFFQNDRDALNDFLSEINGRQPQFVHEIINSFVRKNRLIKIGGKAKLWTVLNKHGLYTASERNFRAYVN